MSLESGPQPFSKLKGFIMLDITIMGKACLSRGVLGNANLENFQKFSFPEVNSGGVCMHIAPEVLQ